MVPFTRSRMRGVIAYCESVTKLTASELLEEGTQCPVCWAEIASFASIYLHRACANVVCSSCFESSLSQQINFDICLICKGYLAEACIENAIPNWHFTYTHIPLPESSGNSSYDDRGPFGATANSRVLSDNKLKLAPLLSPVKRFHSGDSEYFSTGSGTAFTARGGPGNLAATIEKLKADLEKQQRMMDELKDEPLPNRDDSSRFQPRRCPFSWQGSPDPQYENGRNPWSHNNTNTEAHSDTYPWNQNSHDHQHRHMPSFERDNDATRGPWFDTSTRNQYSSNPQNMNSSKSGPRPHLYFRNEQQGNPERSNDHNRHGLNLKDPRHQKRPSPKKQDHKHRGYSGKGLDLALAEHHHELLTQPQQQQPHQHNHNSGRKRKLPYVQKQYNSGTHSLPSYNAYKRSILKKDNRWHTLGNGAKSYRMKMRTWNGVGPPPNINKNLKHARSFPSRSFAAEMDLIE